MLKSCRAIALTCSSLKQQLHVRHISLSGRCQAEVSQEEINRLFAGEDKSSRRRSYSMNRVELIGGVAGDIRLRTGKNGKEFVGFSLVTNRSIRSLNGDVISQEPEFHSVITFNGLDIAKRELTKGKRLYVSGRIHYTPAVLADGTRTNRATIVAETFHVIQPVGRREEMESVTPTPTKSALENVE